MKLRRRFVLAVPAVLALVWLAACAEEPAPPPAPETGAEGAEATLENEPTLRADGPIGAAPERLVVSFPRNVFSPDQYGSSFGETVLRFEPELAGNLRLDDLDTLVFEPATGFVPGTTYQVELEAVETEDGLLREPAAGAWTTEIHVPDFDFVRLSLVDMEARGGRAKVEIAFSAAVNPAEVARHSRFELVSEDGLTRQVADVRFNSGRGRHLVEAWLPNRGLEPGSRLELVLAAGVRAAADDDRRAPGRTADIRFGRAPAMKVVDVTLLESDGGFYLRVLCDDEAVDAELGFWEQETRRWWDVSQRCLPDEASAREAIRFEPNVSVTLAPGRGGFRIFGDFERRAYKLEMRAGLKSVDGGELPNAFTASFDVPARSPRVSFVSQGRYLPRSAWQLLPIKHLNVDRVTLNVRHVPPENLVFWMSDDESEKADERESNLVKRAQLALTGPPDVLTTSYIDLSSYVPATAKGLLELELWGGGGSRDTARILLTDLHLVAKRSASGDVAVWTLDMDSLEPERGTEVRLVRKSGFILAQCETRGGDGGCLLTPPADPTDPSPPFALVARRGDDLTYLKFADLEVEVQEERVAGEPYRGGRPYRAALYSDRGVYRPGETAHLAAIVRGEGDVAPAAGMPVVAKVTDPRGKVVKATTLDTNEAGYVNLDLDFPDFATTGRWQVGLEAAEKRLGEASIQVEEFVPERMKVETEAKRPHYLLGEEMAFDVAARYLFGGVPKDHRVELRCDLEPGNFEPRENAAFHYGVWSPGDGPRRGVTLGTSSGQTDDDGTSSLTCPAGRAGGFAGPARLVARAAVFEAGSGRTTVGTAEVPVHPERFYVGLESGSEKVLAGDELVVDGVVVDWDGRTLDDVAEVEVELVRLVTEYGWYFSESTGRWMNRQQDRPVTEERQTAVVRGGKFKVSFHPRSDGRAFLVRARAGAARTDLELEGRGGWYWYQPEEADRTPAPGRATWLALETPKVARVGQAIEAKVDVPYPGRLMFTAETDEVLESEWVDVEPGPRTFKWKPRQYVPNVYLSAFLIKDPHVDAGGTPPGGAPLGEGTGGGYLPERAFGVASVTLEPVELTHEVKLAVPEEVRSNSRLTVELDLGKLDAPTWATVAAVDEGILSLTGFESPDPFPAIFTRRALGVETFETVGWTLLVPPGSPTSTPAGDAAGALGRVQPVKPVALWSGLREVGKDGKLSLDFDVPQYRGALRVMAVTAGREKMGHADARVLVRDPLVVQATLPRFLTQDDDLRLPVFVTNVSGERRTVAVEVKATAEPVPGFVDSDAPAPVEVVGGSKVDLDLADGAGDTAVFRLRAKAPAGAARLTIEVRSGDLVSTEELVVPLLPAGAKSRVVKRIELEEGTTDLVPELEGWLPLSERSTFWVTNQPYADAFEHLKHLVRYPYGCIEQTSSTTRPLLFVGNLLPTIDPEIAQPGEVEVMAQSGVDRLLSMQTPEGGFSYWPGGSQPVYWGTAYATQILLEAEKLGYQVPKDALGDALDWMERQITNHYERGQHTGDWYSSNAEPYMHYVLALAGRARKARIERLIGEIGPRPSNEEAKEHLYLLWAAMHLAGDQRWEANLKSPDLSLVTDLRTNGWSFYSDRRRRGVMLSTMVDLFGRDEAAEPLVSLVVEMLRGHTSTWYTTQELAWSVVGLGKYMEAGAADFAPPVLVANGRRLEPLPRPAGTPPSDRTWSLARASEYDELTLEVPEKGSGKLYLVLSSEGVRADEDPRVGGEGLVLTRRYRDAKGEPLDFDAGGHALGDVVYVELTLTNNSGERAANLAMVDRIPAGWEIENPRLGRGSAPDWVDVDGLWGFDHLDLRDDRLEVFGHLERGQSGTVVYAVRAVTAGRFTLPPVEAEAMYDPRIWARQAGRKVFVNGPWLETPKKASSPAP